LRNNLQKPDDEMNQSLVIEFSFMITAI
jgi:hypothetical protein